MINNVSCVSQLLPKMKGSSPPSAAPARAQVRALPHDTGDASPTGAHAPAAPGTAPRESAECNRGEGGRQQKQAINSGRSRERAVSHRRVRHPPGASNTRAAWRRHAAKLLPPAPCTSRCGKHGGVAPCVTPQIYLDLGAGRSPVLAGALEQRAGSSERSWSHHHLG